MEIALHVGANCTEGERLLKSLLRNDGRLADRGIAVPGPTRYRPLLREAVLAQVRGDGQAGAREALLDAVLDGREARRLVLSNSTFMALPTMVFDNGFLGNAAAKVRAAGEIFAEDRVELFLAVRNPATWLPVVHAQAKGRRFGAFTGGADPLALRWSDVARRLREAAPEMPLTVWCNEDAALVWGEVMARLAGLPPAEALEGRFDMVAAVLSPDGAERLDAYQEEHPGQTPSQERRTVGAFLDKFALRERIEEEVDLPGWDAGLVDDVTRAYEEDVALLGRLDGVTLVAP